MNTTRSHSFKKSALYTIGLGAIVFVSLMVSTWVDLPSSDWMLTQQGMMWGIQ